MKDQSRKINVGVFIKKNIKYNGRYLTTVNHYLTTVSYGHFTPLSVSLAKTIMSIAVVLNVL